MTKQIAVQEQKVSRVQSFLNRGAVVLTVAATGSAANAAASYDVAEIITNLGAAVRSLLCRCFFMALYCT